MHCFENRSPPSLASNLFWANAPLKVLPLIATAEYGFSDTQAGGLYGMWGILITVWGFVASWMVDKFGVRTTAIFSTAASVVARAVFTFCRSPTSLVVSTLILSPIGDGTFDPCFNVGLKKTTTDLTRPFAYALAYTVMNLGGAFSDNLTDYIRLVHQVRRGAHVLRLGGVLVCCLHGD
jgi:dipeptide/tripeptide permease